MPDSAAAEARSADAFRRFAERECRGYCPTYEALSLRIAEEPEVLALARGALPGQKIPNLLFAAVRWLLLTGVEDPLGACYARAARDGGPGDGDALWRDFLAFCRRHGEAIAAQVRTRRVQTNEVGRCAALWPAFSLLAAGSPGTPLALVEVGCSAGLLLLADRYGYRYRAADGAAAVRGDPDSPVAIECELRGSSPGSLPAAGPAVATRAGLDLAPVDVRDRDQALWLRALVWPDQPQREDRLRRAMEVARDERLDLRAGDGVALLPSVLEGLPPSALPVVFHAAVCWQFGPDALGAFDRALREASTRRPLARVSLESADSRVAALEISLLGDGEPRTLRSARAHPHGAWLEWEKA